jgi:hypothetical protein
MNEYNILDEEEMKQTISISECRNLREVINMVTMGCILNKKEYIRIMTILYQACDRIEKESK